MSSDPIKVAPEKVEYRHYKDESQLPQIIELIEKDLSEPYSVFTYRYFIHNWPQLCLLAYVEDQFIGTIICKLDDHRGRKRGYIAMLAVEKAYRGNKIGTALVNKALEIMKQMGADEVVLETEASNTGAQKLYESLGFAKDKILMNYYLNGQKAYRLKLWFTD
mmetsp:Transcript_34154/g.38797  ORF Transcript_34154/g.38797 Transcript_34154/m.38797 type:complete len:163 (+) Transcript_34154:37-525(+)